MQAIHLRIAAAIIGKSDHDNPADAVLRVELKNQRELSAESSRAISRAVFAYYRWREWLGDQPMTDQLVQAVDLQERFALRYSQRQNREAELPPPFTDAELSAKAVPSWVADEVTFSPEWLRALQLEPTPWLRARPGHGSELANKLRGCKPPAPVSRHVGGDEDNKLSGQSEGLLADTLEYVGEQDLFRTAEFHAGEFEIQDISSQCVGLLCDPKPGETWWDACAGEGGKLLHLSDLMCNRGLIWASDRAEWRLKKLKRRTARAKVFNYRSVLWEGGPKLPTKTKFDGVLLDGPCSGLGTWQRNPQARWTVSPQDVRELSQLQSRLLAHAAPAVKPGGKLIYAVCTLTRAETIDVARSFESAFPQFQPLPLPNPFLPNAPASNPVWIWPQDDGGNGMFICAWRRVSTENGAETK